MKKILIFIIIAGGAYHWYSTKTPAVEQVEYTHNKLIMYSLTTCGFCKEKASQLQARNIRFTEYYIDEQPERQAELNKKLSEAGFKPQRYGTPIFDAYGIMMPNNPSLEEILVHVYAE